MKKILIIEDEPGVQLTLEDLLHSEGYTVVIKGDGLEGEKEARNSVYDLILLDVMLPGKDGFAICRSLRKQEISTPIIMLTARDTNIDIVMGLKQGADDYLANNPALKENIIKVEPPLKRKEYYLIFSKKFYNERKELAKAIWDAIEDYKSTEEYHQMKKEFEK